MSRLFFWGYMVFLLFLTVCLVSSTLSLSVNEMAAASFGVMATTLLLGMIWGIEAGALFSAATATISTLLAWVALIEPSESVLVAGLPLSVVGIALWAEKKVNVQLYKVLLLYSWLSGATYFLLVIPE